ncbi:MAG: DUF4349 domain-containing protein [Chloroflexota bacterium]|nr:DUF4349 domain-containing protein [Chloroflexota bacterium]
MKTKRRLSLLFMLIISLVVSACAAQSPSDSAMDEERGFSESYAPEVPPMKQELSEEQGFENSSTGTASAIERMVVYNARLEIAVEQPEEVMKEVIQMAEAAGGFVVSSNLHQTYTDSGPLPRASLTIRVPAGDLDSIMEAIKAMTPNPKEDVISENVSGQDVTAEYTDLTSRLRNLEAAEEALVKLMEDARDPEDVLNIFEELTYYRGEIEIVKGRMKYLEESADLSAITIEIVPKQSLQPIEIGGWEPKGTAKQAVEALIRTSQSIADGAIWLGIYCLPFLIPLGIAAYFLIRLIKKRRAKKKARKVDVIETSEDQG